MKISRARIERVEVNYSKLKKRPVGITTDRTTWKIIDLKTRTCIAKYSSFVDIEIFLREKSKKK